MTRRLARTTAPLLIFLAALLLPGGAAAANLGERTLVPGKKGKDVKQLQTWLERLGLPVARDGTFGEDTERAVRRWEREQGIEEDAVVDRDQARDMRRDARPRRKVHEYASRTLKRGRSGTDVRALQRFLIDHGIEIEPDGDYGPRTQRAVRHYEKQAGDKVDGKVTRTQAREIRRTAPEVEVFGNATPSNDAASVPASGLRVFPIRGAYEYGDEGARYGDRAGAHKGEDLLADCGTPLAAAEAGTVVFEDTHARAGNYVVIRGAQSGEDHVYMHLRGAASVDKGDVVRTGQRIGEVGDTGNASACLLHFEIWTAPGWYEGGSPRDPRPDLRAWGRDVPSGRAAAVAGG